MSERDPLIGDILAALGQLSDRFSPDSSEMKQWITEHYPNPQILELLQETTLLTMRVINAIGQLEPVNGITISRQYRIPKGSVSKTTRRLLAKKLITQEGLPNNRKEILFRLTPLGRELYEANRAFDAQMEQGFVQFMRRYSPGELAFVLRLLQDVQTASFLDPVPEDQPAKVD
ncbi:MAG TPA: winged helix DNA-binding protein [Phototrophicaceae bacterium]|nr:winged helix DNA-binding protein [Phototrophicaceae bacterium]